MFERFTQEARRVVVVAQVQARWLHADQVEPVHLLLGLTADPGEGGRLLRAAGVDLGSVETALTRSDSDLDAAALAAVGIDLDAVRETAEAAFGPGALDRARERAQSAGHLKFADSSKQVLEQTLRFAVRCKGRRIESRHVLVGLLDVDDPTVTRVLRRLGVEPDALRRQVAGQQAA